MPELRSLFIDFNCYFAAVEQQTQPHLRGLPVGVAPVLAETTCCIAASYEARRFGVKTGTRVADARRLCPGITIVEARPPLYVQYHERAVAAVDRIVPVRQVVSIDEMECELPRRWRTREAATRIAQQVKAEILATVGDHLHTSIGIASNQLLAKAASDLHKPNGLVVLEMADIPRLLHPLPATALCGVGPRMGQRLARHGITTLADLFAAPPAVLRAAWGGVQGAEMHDQLRGLWAPLRATPRRSLGHSHVLPPDLRTPEAAYAVLCRLLHKAAMRLRTHNIYATQLSVHVRQSHRNAPESGGWRSAHLEETQDTLALLHSLRQLWRSGLHRLPAPMAVGVVLSGLVDASQHQRSLFDANTPDTATPPARLMQTVDALNRRFGKNTLYFGSAHAGRDHAPMRIAFNRIPALDAEA